jgi:hypothetical protein
MRHTPNPWDLVYNLYKEHYTREQIDEMLMCELTELINNYYEEEKAQQ